MSWDITSVKGRCGEPPLSVAADLVQENCRASRLPFKKKVRDPLLMPQKQLLSVYHNIATKSRYICTVRELKQLSHWLSRDFYVAQ
jgi:hypothetical protein